MHALQQSGVELIIQYSCDLQYCTLCNSQEWN